MRRRHREEFGVPSSCPRPSILGLALSGGEQCFLAGGLAGRGYTNSKSACVCPPVLYRGTVWELGRHPDGRRMDRPTHA